MTGTGPYRLPAPKSAGRSSRYLASPSLVGLKVRPSTFAQLRNDGFNVQAVGETPSCFALDESWWAFPAAWCSKPISSIPADILLAEDCSVFPTGAVVVEDRYVFGDTLFVSGSATPRDLGELTRDEPLTVLVDFPVEEVSEPAFVMTNFRSSNFYHFVHEVIGRLYFLERAELLLGQPLPILMNRPRYPMQSFLLNAVFGGRRIIHHRKNTIVTVKQGVLSRQPVNRYGICVPAVRHMRERLRCLAANGESGHSVYIARRDGSNRRFGRILANEEELIGKLEKNGFRTVVVADVTPDQQLKLFSSARATVGIHGAGLSNVVFMAEGGVLEISGFPTSPDYFARNCKLFGLEYALAETRADMAGAVRVDMAVVDQFLDRLSDRRVLA